MHGAVMGSLQSSAHGTYRGELSLANRHRVGQASDLLYEIQWQALRASRYLLHATGHLSSPQPRAMHADKSLLSRTS